MWSASSEDPQLALQFSGRLPRGLCRVRFSISAGESVLRSTMYFDNGSGFSEACAARFSLRSGAYADALVYIPLSIRRIRFDPSEAQDQFQISNFSIESLGLWSTLKFILSERLSRGGVRRRLGARARTVLGMPLDPDYQRFQSTNEPRLEDIRDSVEAHIEKFSRKSVFSILMPTWNTPVDVLERAIGSVSMQVYPHWELCIADDASTDIATKACLQKWAEQEPRIHLQLLSSNCGISEATNQALHFAGGDFVCFLDHDDELSPLALYHFAAEIDRRPELELIYSDEDKIDAKGRRVEPHFKTAWNPELLHGQNYITHLAAYRTQTVRDLGGLRQSTDGSQDHDLALRFEAQSDGQKVRHVPVVLYHWRSLAGSTARTRDAKVYAHSAGEQALRDRFSIEPGTKVRSGELALTYRVDYALPEVAPRASIIIPTRDGYVHASRCIDSILSKTVYPDFEILLVNNQSRDAQTLRWLEHVNQNDTVRVIDFDAPFNYSAINNFAAEKARGSVLVLLNDDTEIISPDWLREMVSLAVRPDIGAVGAKLYYPEGSIQHAGVALGIGGVAGHTHWRFPKDDPGYLGRLKVRQAVSAVTGACLAVERQKFDAVGGLDAANLTIAFNDVDLCLKLSHQGWRNVWTPFAELYHFESISRGAEDTPEKVMRFNQEADWMKTRWGEKLNHDPYYHRCFSRTAQDMSLETLPLPYRPWEGRW